MLTVAYERGICLIALMTHPYCLNLYAKNNEINFNAIRCLINGHNGYTFHYVTTVKNLAKLFANEYTASIGLEHKVVWDQHDISLKHKLGNKAIWQGKSIGQM